MKAVMTELFDYNYHINEKFIVAIETTDTPKEEMVKFFSHILTAHGIWLERIKGKIPSAQPWDLLSIQQFREKNLTTYQHTSQLLSVTSQADLEKTITYNTSKGEPFQNLTRDIFMQIINHSTHHRAQIALLLRQSNIAPPISDYIFYKRETPG